MRLFALLLLSLGLSATGITLAFTAEAGPNRWRKHVSVAIVGQSNEAGTGERQAEGLELAPQRDPIPPNGGRRSMWPLLEELAARRGVKMTVWNSAVGATSLVHGWAGVVERWQAGKIIARGTYVLAGGQLFKCVSPPGDQPLVMVREMPAGHGRFVTRGDGITWQHIGRPRPQDVPDHVYGPGDPLFDPNGYVAVALSGFDKLPPGERWTFISIGQGDAGSFWTVSREQYKLALINVTQAALARGSKVAIGFSVYRDNPASEANYQSRLLPGRLDALQHFKGDPRVIPGANLREALGKLPSDPPKGPGLVERIHMNDDAYGLASHAWLDALTRAGWFPSAPARR